MKNDPRSCERNLCNCERKPEKISGLHWGLNPWPRDTGAMLTNWAMKPLTLGAGQLWVHMFPWKKWMQFIYEMNHIWTALISFTGTSTSAVKCRSHKEGVWLPCCQKKEQRHSSLKTLAADYFVEHRLQNSHEMYCKAARESLANTGNHVRT